ncbi:NIL domain-containing protein [Nostoc sp. 'Peltigera membranacea cyanobiont' N6]|uniref:NIL domain-containing protein n=1 Tax=Nostoc sp. 'Peltigera membranacea cyanobiont' N6 TaxID=1261031 RepID=UPI000CF36013|nr:NIL domain-containing protein [Nostoc sp. 'Peltigera membranacea cyanobiont' N6]AVH64714.1 NIL domain-containing protein [Nostoc sp. 'Peltigera membranacea cyanobiont' N6]
MAALNNRQARLSLVSSVYKKSQVTQIRLRIYIPKCYLQAPVISQLISAYGLVVNITKAMIQPNTDGEGCFDIELRGTVSQISSGLAYLESLNLRIVGKPNADDDSWFY